MKSLTSITAHGVDQEVWEVYADDSRTRTAGFTFRDADASLLETALDKRRRTGAHPRVVIPLTYADCLQMAADTFMSVAFTGDFVELYRRADQELLDAIEACQHSWLRTSPAETLELIDDLADHIYARLDERKMVAVPEHIANMRMKQEGGADAPGN